MSGGHLAYKHTFDKVRDSFWWPTYITTSKLGVMTATLANDVKLRIMGLSFLQVAFRLIAHFNVS